MSKYQYNGIELPQLPEWDKATYPHAYIGKNSGGTIILMVVNATRGVTKTGSLSSVGLSTVKFKYDSETDTWVSLTTTAIITVFWSNTDVLYNQSDENVAAGIAGTLYLPASDPIPVPTLTARDLYRKINGKPTNLTLYKKLGGKLIPLDEYTKEVKT